MIATCGFGESYPIMMYVYEKSQKEIDFSLGRNLFEEELHDDKITLGSTPEKNRSIKSDRSDSRRSIGKTDRNSDEDMRSEYSDGTNMSRLGKSDYESDYGIYKTPNKGNSRFN